MEESAQLIRFDVETARKYKWKRGNDEHGDIMQKDPAIELWEEMLDSINYCRVLAGDGQILPSEREFFMRSAGELRRIAETIRQILMSHSDRQYIPTHFPFA